METTMVAHLQNGFGTKDFYGVKKFLTKINSVHTRGIVKKRGFTRGVCKNR